MDWKFLVQEGMNWLLSYDIISGDRKGYSLVRSNMMDGICQELPPQKI